MVLTNNYSSLSVLLIAIGHHFCSRNWPGNYLETKKGVGLKVPEGQGEGLRQLLGGRHFRLQQVFPVSVHVLPVLRRWFTKNVFYKHLEKMDSILYQNFPTSIFLLGLPTPYFLWNYSNNKDNLCLIYIIVNFFVFYVLRFF